MRQAARVLAGILIIIMMAFGAAHALAPELESGVGYLTTAQGADGSWTGASTTDVPATAHAIEALDTLGLSADAAYANAAAWLNAQELTTTGDISLRALVLAAAGADVQTLASYADMLTYAWGGYDGYDTNLFDTALAMQALEQAGAMDQEALAYALYYVFTSQNDDGGWGFSAGNDSNTYVTALVSMSLRPYTQYVDTANALEKAKGYLLLHQNVDGGFGSSPSTVYETAMAYMALVGQTTDETVLGSAVNYLKANQAADGSWNADPYQSALALRALHLAEANPATPEPPVVVDPAPEGEVPGDVSGEPGTGTTLSLSGTVTASITDEPIASATVQVAGSTSSAVTDGTGSYIIEGIDSLVFSVQVSADGYLSRTYAVSVDAYGSYELNITLSPDGIVSLNGRVLDAATGEPIAGADVSMVGTALSSVSAADGSFSLECSSDVELTLLASAAGYNSGELRLGTLVSGQYNMDISLNKSRISTIEISTLAIDRQTYGIYENISVTSVIQNNGDAAVQMMIRGEIYDSSGTLVTTAAPEQNLFDLSPGVSQEIGFVWNTMQTLPGGYELVVKVYEAGTASQESYLGNVLAERAVSFNVSASALLTGVIEMDPPAGYLGMQSSVEVTGIIRNTGNTAVSSPMVLNVYFGGQIIYTMSVSVGEIVVNDVSVIDFGSFQTEQDGLYRAEIVPEDNSIESSITLNYLVGVHASGTFSAYPADVDFTDPHTTARIDLTGVGTQLAHEQDPILPIIEDAMQKAVVYVSGPASSYSCNGCHIQSQAFVGLNDARGMVPLDEELLERLYNQFVSWQDADGAIRGGYSWRDDLDTSLLGIWALSSWPDQAEAKPYILNVADYVIGEQLSNGSWKIFSTGWWGDPQGSTALTVIGLKNAYLLSADPKYLESMEKAAAFLLQAPLSYKPLQAAYQIMGLKAVLDVTDDPSLKETITAALADKADILLQAQKGNGSWRVVELWTMYPRYALSTAQAVYALMQIGYTGEDDVIRNAVYYLLNTQSTNGGWGDVMSSSWVMMTLPKAMRTFRGISAEVYVELPENVQLTNAVPFYSAHEGNGYTWDISGINSAGEDIALSLDLPGLVLGEKRDLAVQAYLTLRQDGSGEQIVIPMDIPQITGVSPLQTEIWSDKQQYTVDEDVNLGLFMQNLTTRAKHVTRELVVEDVQSGGTAYRESMAGNELIPVGYAQWAYRIPLSFTSKGTLTKAMIYAQMDFDEILSSLDVPGATLDGNSFRLLEFDSNNDIVQEILFNLTVNPGNEVVLKWELDETLLAGDEKTYYLYFDILENGAKEPPAGYLEIVNNNFIATSDDRTITSVYEYDEEGNFGPPKVIDVQNPYWWNNQRGVVVNDFNNDGYNDVMTGLNAFYFFERLPSEELAFKSSKWAASGGRLHDATTADYNNDGNADVVFSFFDLNKIYLLLGNGDGSFAKSEIPVPNDDKHYRGKDSADFNGDGTIDLVIGDSYGKLFVYINKGDAVFEEPIHLGTIGLYPYGVAAGDFDSDGFADILAKGYDGPETYLIKGNGDGTFGAFETVPSLFINDWVSFETGDFNTDGRLDVIVGTAISADVLFYSGNGDGTFQYESTILDQKQAVMGIGTAPYIPDISVTAGDVEQNGESISLSWNTGDILAGTYRLHILTSEDGLIISDEYVEVEVLSDASATSRISVDKIAYGAGEDVAVSATVGNSSTNALLENLTARETITDDGGTTLHAEEKAIALLVPGQSVDMKTYWNTADSEAGTYTATVSVLKGTTVLSESTASFTILSSSETGEGLRGALSADPSKVDAGENVALMYTLENQGNVDLSGLVVWVIVVDPQAKEALQTYEATVDLARDTTVMDSFTASTSGLATGVYVAVLQAQTADMEGPKTLGQTRFEVEAPSVEAEKGLGELGQHVLVWLNYPWQSTTSQQDRPDVALVESSLQAAGVRYHIVYDKKDFQSELRSPFYTDYLILGDHHPLEGHYSDELRERVFGGRGLVSSMFNRQNLDGPVFGVKVTGYLNHGDYPVELAESDLSAGAVMQSGGRSLRISADDPASVIAWVMQNKNKQGTVAHPAIVQRTYGLGKVLFYAFDLGLSTGDYAQFESLVVNSLAHVHQPADYSGTLYPYQLVPVNLSLWTLGEAMDVRVEEKYPDDIRLFDPVTWTWVTENPWLIDLTLEAGVTAGFEYYALTPDRDGRFKFTSRIGMVDGDKFSTDTKAVIELRVSDIGSLAKDVLDELRALEVSAEDQVLIDTAEVHIKAVNDRNDMSADEINANINDLLMAAGLLHDVTSADTTDIILMLDKALFGLEGRAYFGE